MSEEEYYPLNCPWCRVDLGIFPSEGICPHCSYEFQAYRYPHDRRQMYYMLGLEIMLIDEYKARKQLGDYVTYAVLIVGVIFLCSIFS